VVRAFVSKVPTASGGTAVRVLWKQGRRQVGMEYVGSAHAQAEIDLLVKAAWDVVHANQDPLLGETGTPGGEVVPAVPARAVVTGTESAVLWGVLTRVWAQLGFDAAVPDRAFKALALARVIEPTSKLDSARVLAEVGQWAPTNATIYRCLARCQDRGYRDRLAGACWERAKPHATLLMYDVTTLYFETDTPDEFRIPGYSKERRLEPQIVVGVLVDQGGLPLGLAAFEGNLGETLTITPVVTQFARLRGLDTFTVVADAGMLSQNNLRELQDAGFDFIVGSRIAAVPWAVGEFEREHPDEPVADRQVFVEPVVMGAKKTGARQYAVVYQYRAKRAARDLKTIDAQVAKAEAAVAGTRKKKNPRFVTVVGKDKLAVDRDLVASARARAGYKGYVTSLPVAGCPGRPVPEGVAPVDPLTVIDSYHQLFEVERSFRMSKTDLRARPVFSHVRDSIEAHLTMVMAALAVSRTIQDRTGLSIRRVTRALKPLRAAHVSIGQRSITIPPAINTDTQAIIDDATHDPV